MTCSQVANRESFVDFIPELQAQCPLINMKTDKDYRQEGLKATSTFLSPINSETAAQFNDMFKQVVGTNVETETSLQIPHEKRHISVPVAGVDATGARVARFTFDDLCVSNMGRADYCALAEEYHTIFMDGVPKFKPDLGAEFRRFVSLTDILYAKKVSLYLQSEVPTNTLFSDAKMCPELDMDEMWAFTRCSSMLQEMQSTKYKSIVWLMRNHMLQESARHL